MTDMSLPLPLPGIGPGAAVGMPTQTGIGTHRHLPDPHHDNRGGRARQTLRLPFCIDCAESEFNRLEQENDALDASERLPRERLRLRARFASGMVRLLGEWVCPRCEKVDVGGLLTPEVVPLGELLPNRAARRRFERSHDVRSSGSAQ